MATKKKLIFQSLDNLSKENFLSFCAALVDREGDRRVPQSKVEGLQRFEVTNVLVSTFDDEAPAIVSELLESVGCEDEAKKLVPEKHFVDKHRIQLIQRVTNIDPILEGLLERGVLQYGVYEEISQTSGTQDKMKKIYDLALRSGDDVKNIFMELLHQQESYLVKDLLKDP
ncbi:apoptosis-associated speck-like protein containing a CARD [Stigmatopora nigra]